MNRNYIPEHRVGQGFRWFFFYLALIVIACIASAFFATRTEAQTPPAPTFDCDKKSGESPLSTSCTWNYPGATTCTAGGAGTRAAWTGTIPCSGTRSLSGISNKLTLTLDATAAPTEGKMRLKWNFDGKNTDGTNATLGGYLIEYGTSSSSLTQTVSIPLTAVEVLTPTVLDPQNSAYQLTGLAAGTWFAALKARTPGCFPNTGPTCYESVRSGVTSKPVTTTPGGALPQLTVTIEPYSVPTAPTNLTATEATAFEIRTDSTGKLLAQRIGVLRPGTVCASEGQQTVDGVVYSLVDRAAVDVVNFSNGSDAWVPTVWAKCG